MRIPALMLAALLALGLDSTGFARAGGYLLDCEVWINGQRQEDAVVMISQGEVSPIEFKNADIAWRLEFEAEETLPAEQAPAGAFWVSIAIHEQVDGEWEHLLDTLLGVVSDRPAALAIASGDGDGPEQAQLYLAIRGSRLKSGTRD